MIKKRDQKKLGNKGFSLVELIVVIAIMAILVGVLAPVLIRNIEKSRESKDLQALDSVKSAVTTALAREDCYKELVDGKNDKEYTFTLATRALSATGATLTQTNDELSSILGSNGVKLSSANLKNLTTITVKVAKDGSVTVGAYDKDKKAFTGTIDTSIVFEVK